MKRKQIIADVAEDSPAAKAGFQPGDVIAAINGRRVDSLTVNRFYLTLYSLQDGQTIRVDAHRGTKTISGTLTASAPPDDCQQTSLLDARSALVAPLGILGLASPTGVLVAARVDTPNAPEDLLFRGDIIRAVNGAPVLTPDALRGALAQVGPEGAVVLQVERQGQLTYVAFERE